MAVIQHKEFTGTFPLNSGAVAFDSPVTAGSTIVVCATFYHDTADNTCTTTDNVNAGNYSEGTIREVGPYHAKIFYKANVSSGSTTVTVNPPDGNTDLWFSITEISTPDATPFDAETGTTGTSNAPSVNLTTGVADAIVFGAFVHNDGTDPTLGVGSGYTLIHEQEGGSTVMPGLSEYQVFNTSGSKTVNGTISVSAGWAIVAASFEQAAANVTQDPAQAALAAQGLAGSLGFTINMPAEP